MNAAKPETRTQPPKRQNQWALIWREFRKRKLAMLALMVIFTLVTISIFAPIIANNRPLVYHGVNYSDYREGMRTTLALTKAFASNDRTHEFAALERQLSYLSEHLEGETAVGFAKLADNIRALAKALPLEPSQQKDLMTLRTQLRRDFDTRKISLRHRTVYPVVHSIHAFNFTLIVALLIFILFPAWGRVWQKRSTAHPARNLLLIMVGLPLLAGFFWYLAIPEKVDRTDYKSAVFTLDDTNPREISVLYDSCLWPLVPFGLDESNLADKELEPGAYSTNTSPDLPWVGPHHMGTDGIGRDVCARMIWGGRISLSVGLVAVSIYLTIGILVGSMAGFFRGGVDLVVSRIIEIVICFPSFFLILTIVAFIGSGIFNIMVVIGLTGWTGVARLVRGEFLRLADQEFVLAGRALGYSSLRIILRHILPNAMAPVLVSATFGIAGAILTESALSFLGFGIQVPTPSWGGILSSGRESLIRAPFLILFPGIAIFITITAYNLVGEALRDASDPRLRGQD